MYCTMFFLTLRLPPANFARYLRMGATLQSLFIKHLPPIGNPYILPLCRPPPDGILKKICVIPFCSHHIYGNAHSLQFGYGGRIHPFDVLWRLSANASPVVKHHLGKYYSVKRFAILQSEEYGSYAILAEGAACNVDWFTFHSYFSFVAFAIVAVIRSNALRVYCSCGVNLSTTQPRVAAALNFSISPM